MKTSITLFLFTLTLAAALPAHAETIYLAGVDKEGQTSYCRVRFDLEKQGDGFLLSKFLRSGDSKPFTIQLSPKPRWGILSPRYEGASSERLGGESHLAVYLQGSDLSHPEALAFGLNYPTHGNVTHWDESMKFGLSRSLYAYDSCTSLKPISREEFEKANKEDGGAELPDDAATSEAK
ncbi:MAG: hypothetical protein ACXVB9_07775 [Bdellovibrionota bacterium]